MSNWCSYVLLYVPLTNTDKRTTWNVGTCFLTNTCFPSCPQIRLCSVRPRRRLKPRTVLTRAVQNQLAPRGSQALLSRLGLCHTRGRCRSGQPALCSGDWAPPAHLARCQGPRGPSLPHRVRGRFCKTAPEGPAAGVQRCSCLRSSFALWGTRGGRTWGRLSSWMGRSHRHL